MKTKLKGKTEELTRKRKKAIEIAKDVIAAIKAQSILISKSGYAYAITDGDKPTDGVDFRDKYYDHSVKDLRKNQGLKCQVCALGGMLVTLVDKHNKVTLRELEEHGGELAYEKLKCAFSPTQLALIESVFEGWLDYSSVVQNAKIKAYFNKYPVASERLTAIMRNIIRNKGQFVLPKRIR